MSAVRLSCMMLSRSAYCTTGGDIMHRIGQKTTLQERVTIGKLATAGRTDAQIAAKLVCSVWTVRKWRRIFVHQGRAGFKNRMGRPAPGPLGTVSLDWQTAIRHLREA